MELIGRVQRQQEDNRYYTCILYIMVRGTPVYGVIPSDTAPHPTLTPTSTPAPLGHQLSPVVSPQSSQIHLNLPGQDNADSEVQQVSKGVCEDAQRAEDARQGFSSQQPPGSKRISHAACGWQGVSYGVP